jgi:hypothetical protein
MAAPAKNGRWVKTVTTDSTHLRKGSFTKSPELIARELASKKVSPKGPGSGMRMLTYFINRAGKGAEPQAAHGAGEGEGFVVGAHPPVQEGRLDHFHFWPGSKPFHPPRIAIGDVTGT